MIHNLVAHSKDLPWLGNNWFCLLLGLVERLGLSDQKQEDSMAYSTEGGPFKEHTVGPFEGYTTGRNECCFIKADRRLWKYEGFERVKLSIGQTT